MKQMDQQKYVFELLVVDPDGSSEIQTPKSLLYGLLSTDKLWSAPQQTEEGDTIIVTDGDLVVRIKYISVLDNIIEAAFLLQIESSNYERIEAIRHPILSHLRNRLHFSHLRLLTDDVSIHIGNAIYPIISGLEHQLRRYISFFFTQKIGLDWWQKLMPDNVLQKADQRRSGESRFGNLVETDLRMIDFLDLGEIVYKHKLGFSDPQKLVDRILNINPDHVAEELERLKSDLDSNYNRFFKENFKDHNFERKWKQLFTLKSKVDYNRLFVEQDLQDARRLAHDLSEVITNAVDKIDAFRFSIEEQEAIREMSHDEESDVADNRPSGLKVLGKVDLADMPRRRPQPRVEEEEPTLHGGYARITEEEFMRELKIAEASVERNSYMSYVGLKSFVTKVLGYKNYDIGATYAIANLLRDKGAVEIYEINDGMSYYPAKAIRIPQSTT